MVVFGLKSKKAGVFALKKIKRGIHGLKNSGKHAVDNPETDSWETKNCWNSKVY